jgi:hypothetical protein
MRRRLLLLVFTVFLVACARRSGCDPIDLDLDLSGEDKCTPAGGTCSGLFCPPNTVPSTLDCDCFLSGCCMPGGGGSSGGTSGGPGPPPPDREGTCNGFACATGCVCRPKAIATGGCTATCDCGGSSDAGDTDASASDGGVIGDGGDVGDGGSDAGPDAADAGDPDGGDAGDPDAGDGGDDGGMSTPIDAGPPKSCGLITCAARCDCLSQSLSVCQCRSSSCNP